MSLPVEVKSQLVDAQQLLKALLSGPVEDGVEKLGDDGLRQEFVEDVAQLALDRDVVDGELLVDDPVAQPHNRVIFASTPVAAVPREEQRPLVVTEDSGAMRGPTSELSKDFAQKNPPLCAGAHGDELHLGC